MGRSDRATCATRWARHGLMSPGATTKPTVQHSVAIWDRATTALVPATATLGTMALPASSRNAWTVRRVGGADLAHVVAAVSAVNMRSECVETDRIFFCSSGKCKSMRDLALEARCPLRAAFLAFLKFKYRYTIAVLFSIYL